METSTPIKPTLLEMEIGAKVPSLKIEESQ